MKDAKLKAILDGNYITAFRTAAVAGLAIDTFAKKILILFLLWV